MNYWLNLFSKESWLEFSRAGRILSGFTASRWGIAEQVQIDDLLLCYMIGGRGFFAVTQVTGEPFYDASPRWIGFDFSSWIPLKVTLLVPDGHGIRPPSLPTISWIKDKHVNYWKGRVAGSPAQIDAKDGDIIVASLRELGRRFEN